MVNSASNLQDICIPQHFYFSTFPSSNLYKCKLQCKIIQAYQRAMALIVQNGKMEVLTGQRSSGGAYSRRVFLFYLCRRERMAGQGPRCRPSPRQGKWRPSKHRDLHGFPGRRVQWLMNYCAYICIHISFFAYIICCLQFLSILWYVIGSVISLRALSCLFAGLSVCHYLLNGHKKLHFHRITCPIVCQLLADPPGCLGRASSPPAQTWRQWPAG